MVRFHVAVLVVYEVADHHIGRLPFLQRRQVLLQVEAGGLVGLQALHVPFLELAHPVALALAGEADTFHAVHGDIGKIDVVQEAVLIIRPVVKEETEDTRQIRLHEREIRIRPEIAQGYADSLAPVQGAFFRRADGRGVVRGRRCVRSVVDAADDEVRVPALVEIFQAELHAGSRRRVQVIPVSGAFLRQRFVRQPLHAQGDSHRHRALVVFRGDHGHLAECRHDAGQGVDSARLVAVVVADQDPHKTFLKKFINFSLQRYGILPFFS